ncbi:unnamed protein product [Urochloa humidicola]
MSHEQRALKNAKKREARASTNNSKGNPNRPTEHQYSEDVVPTGVSVVTAVENTEPRSGNMDSDDIGQDWLFRNDSATLTRIGRSDLLKRATCVSTGDAAGTMQGGRLLTENTLSAGAGVHGDMDADDEALEEEDLDCQEPVEGCLDHTRMMRRGCSMNECGFFKKID